MASSSLIRRQRQRPKGAASLALLMLNSVLLDMFQGGLKADSVKLYLGLLVLIRPDTRCFTIVLASLPWIAVLDNLPTAGTLNLVSPTLTSSRKNLTSPRCPEALLKLEWAK